MYRIKQRFTLETKDYSDLAPIFVNLFNAYLNHSGLYVFNQKVEGKAVKAVSTEKYNMIIYSNMKELENNQKPPGFNPGTLENIASPNRFIFPIVDIENGASVTFDILWSEKPGMRYSLAESLSRILNNAELWHDIDEERDYLKKPKVKKIDPHTQIT